MPFDQNALLQQIADRFEAGGLHLVVVDPDRLPVSLRGPLQAAWGVSRTGLSRVLIVVNQGGRFWNLVDRCVSDPIDAFSRELSLSILGQIGGSWEYRLIYPGDCPVSLQALGRESGLGAGSWLGQSIHPEWGTWFAFRAVVLTSCPLPVSMEPPSPDSCADCPDRPCVTACPVSAPSVPFDLAGCVDQRLGDSEQCKATCIARLACPLGDGWRYPESLVGYLYRRSLDSVQRWRERSGH